MSRHAAASSQLAAASSPENAATRPLAPIAFPPMNATSAPAPSDSLRPGTRWLLAPSLRYLLHPAVEQNDALRRFVRSLPETFEREGKEMFRGRNVVKLFSLPGGPDGLRQLCVKRYKRPVLAQRVVYTCVRRSKALRAYLFAEEFRRRGFDTPFAAACAEHLSGGLMDDGYLVTGVTSLPPIRDCLVDPPAFDRDVAEAFARFAARLHEAGILHGDLNCTNVLYRRAEAGIAFTLIDTNRSRFYPPGRTIPVAECFENLTRFTGRMDLFEFVARAYAEARRFGNPEAAVAQLVETKRRHDAAWQRRKALTRRL